jgi:hypothetical protein
MTEYRDSLPKTDAEIDRIRERARSGGLHAQERLINYDNSALDVKAAATRLGVTPETLEEMRCRQEVLSVEWQGDLLAATLRERLYPAWQFLEGGGILPGLAKVLQTLERSSWEKLAFLLSPSLRLNGSSPLEALKNDRLDVVISAAVADGEQGAD